jgi:putative aminopeptidase FrvX
MNACDLSHEPRRCGDAETRKSISLLLQSVVLLLLSSSSAFAQSVEWRFLDLLNVDGVSGHESNVREAIRRQLPPWATPRVDELGNLIVTIGSGSPQIAFIAALDEPGYVVSRITEDGYLRLHRHTARVQNPLLDQFFLGQPVVVRTSSGKLVAGVTATSSTHLRGLSPAAEVARIKTVHDLWVDVGAESAADVEKLGIRMLDPVSLRDRAEPLAGARVAGYAAQLRAGAITLLEVVRPFFSDTPAARGTLTLAWITQSQFGGRGLARLARTIKPDEAVILTPDPPNARPPAEWEQTRMRYVPIPALFGETPVQVVSAADIDAVANRLRADASLQQRSNAAGAVGGGAFVGHSAPGDDMLKSLIEIAGVSGHEIPVREAIARHLPPWATAQVDAKGNLTVNFGEGGKELVFVAHMDEVGFEVTAIRDDGTAAVRARGGMYLSLYEAHPMFVVAGGKRIPAVMTPRRDYANATTSQPEIEALSLYFGTSSAAETRALGVAEGQPATIRKKLDLLGPHRASGRSMDDRAGSTALLLALKQIDPKLVKNRVTFAWVVEEETGLNGAAFLASRMKPDHVFAVDTFVSTDAPLDVQHLAHAELGKGAVLRGMDSRTVAPAATIDRIVSIAREANIPLQIGVTQGGTDASAFSAGGAVDVGLSWPGRYSHSPVEVIDRRDLEALAKLIATLARMF